MHGSYDFHFRYFKNWDQKDIPNMCHRTPNDVDLVGNQEPMQFDRDEWQA